MLPTDLKAIYRDTGEPNRAVPVTTECALAGAFTTGEVTTSPTPIPTTYGAAAYPAVETVWPEIWPALHNFEIWQTGPDGTYAWRNDATGYSHAE